MVPLCAHDISRFFTNEGRVLDIAPAGMGDLSY